MIAFYFLCAVALIVASAYNIYSGPYGTLLDPPMRTLGWTLCWSGIGAISAVACAILARGAWIEALNLSAMVAAEAAKQ